MRHCYSVVAGVPQMVLPAPAIGAQADRRWSIVLRRLSALRRRGRRAVRIVDASCGAGDLLIQAARSARALGFVAIEGRGVDRDPAMIARARASAGLAVDPAIGLQFDVSEPQSALEEEADFPADIVLYAAQDGDAPLRQAAVAAGNTVLGTATRNRLTAA